MGSSGTASSSHNATSAAAVDLNKTLSNPDTNAVMQGLGELVQFLGMIPRYCPSQPLEAKAALEAIVVQRAAIAQTAQMVLNDVLRLMTELDHSRRQGLRQADRLQRLQEQVDGASDIAIAADAQMVLAAEDLRRCEEQKKDLAAEFERKLFRLSQVDAPNARVLAREYRSEDCARVERECDELRQQLMKRNLWLVERAAWLEKLSRVTEEHQLERAAAADWKKRCGELEVELLAQRRAAEIREEAAFAERGKFMSEIEQHRAQRHTLRELVVIERLQALRAEDHYRQSAWARWMHFTQARKMETVRADCEAVKTNASIVNSGRQIKFKEEKQVLMREVSRLTERIDTLTARNRELEEWQTHHQQQQLNLLSNTVQTQKHEDSNKASSALSNHGGASLHRNDELQLQAMQSYHTLCQVLHGLKRRLGLDAMKIPALAAAERATEPLPVIVFDWISESFSFLSHVLKIEDRLLKIKVKLAYVHLQIKPQLERVSELMRFSQGDPPRLAVLRKQHAQYSEIHRGYIALRGQIEATAKALISSTDPKKKEQIAVLTNTFEADVVTFLEKVAQNRKIQFTLELQLTRLQNQAATTGSSTTNKKKGADGKGGFSSHLLPPLPSPVGKGGHRSPSTTHHHHHGEGADDAAGTPHGFHEGSELYSQMAMSNEGEGRASTSPREGEEGEYGRRQSNDETTPLPRPSSIGELLPKLRKFQGHTPEPGRSGISSWEVSRPTTNGTLCGVVGPLPTTSEEAGGRNSAGDGTPGSVDVTILDMDHQKQQAAAKGSSKLKSSSLAPVTLSRNIPAPGEDLHKGGKRVGGPTVIPVMDTWAERQRQAMLVTSILKPTGPDGRMNLKDFQEMQRNAATVVKSLRRSYPELPKQQRGWAKTVPATTMSTTQQSLSPLQQSSSSMQGGGSTHSESGANVLLASPGAALVLSDAPDVIPMRQTILRSPLLLEKHRVTAEDTNQIVQQLLPRADGS